LFKKLAVGIWRLDISFERCQKATLKAKTLRLTKSLSNALALGLAVFMIEVGTYCTNFLRYIYFNGQGAH
jgi:hypothetical protein